MAKKLPSNWRKNIRFTRNNNLDGTIEFKIDFIKGKTPKGFYTNIGFLNVCKLQGGNFVDESYLEEHFRGRGLGFSLYQKALQDLGNLSTDYHHISRSAKKLWRKLSKKYKHKEDFWTGILTVYK